MGGATGQQAGKVAGYTDPGFREDAGKVPFPWYVLTVDRAGDKPGPPA